jgi:hypothetical protein
VSRARTWHIAAACLGCLVALVGAAPASADVLAAAEVPSAARTDLDIAVINAATGVRSTLPAGVNTAADELHPSLSADGSRLAFERVDHAAGTTRILVADLTTSRVADLFNAFEAQDDRPGPPLMSPDGQFVQTGHPFEQRGSGADTHFVAAFNQVFLRTFTGPPFDKGVVGFLSSQFGFAGRTDELVQEEGLGTSAFEVRPDSGQPAGELGLRKGTSATVIADDGFLFAHPALSTQAHVLVFQRAPRQDGTVGPSSLVFRSDSPGLSDAPISGLPAIVNASGGIDELRPAFSADDRYLGFVRDFATSERLFVFDTQTQTLLNPTGIGLGIFPKTGIGATARLDGGISLELRNGLVGGTLLFNGTLTVDLRFPTGVGILVQRITGQHRLLGMTVPTLRLVGRVPFGPQRAGHFRIRWNRKVNGRRLRRGRYLVTVRGVTKKGVVHELGKSFTLRVR